MSVLTSPHRELTAPAAHPKLQAVAAPARRMAALPFVLVLAVLAGAGLVGLLLLNTSLQSQAIELRNLKTAAAKLHHVEARLGSELDRVAAPQELARRASTEGMRPDIGAAFLVLGDTPRIIGKPMVTKGDELPSSVVKTPEQMAAEKKAAEEQRAADAKKAAQAQQAAEAKKTAEAKKAADANKAASATQSTSAQRSAAGAQATGTKKPAAKKASSTGPR